MIFVISDLAVRGVFMVLIVTSILVGLWNAVKIREVHLSMNGRLDRLLSSAVGEAHAAGVAEERERTIAREESLRLAEKLEAADGIKILHELAQKV